MSSEFYTIVDITFFIVFLVSREEFFLDSFLLFSSDVCSLNGHIFFNAENTTKDVLKFYCLHFIRILVPNYFLLQ